jgi:hypothetical protein
MADSMAANPITVDPVTGAIGADFSGHVHAAGLDLDEAVFPTTPDDSSIRWLDGAGVMRERIIGIGNPNPVDRLSRIQVVAGDFLGGPVALTLDGHMDGADIRDAVSIFGGLIPQTVLINGAEESSFLQLGDVNPGRAFLSWGVDSLSLSLQNSNTKAITHNLQDAGGNPIVPEVVLVTPGIEPQAIAQTFSYTNTQFTVRIQHRDAGTNFAAGTNVDVRWIAIGP